MQSALLKTPLNEAHRNLGARMVDFGGWDMPVMYTNQIEEHHAVRKAAGLFDVSHMGEILVSGPDALKLLQKVIARDLSMMGRGQVTLGVLCNEQGGIIDDLTIYKYNEERYMLVVNAGTTKEDYYWIAKYAGGLNVKVNNISDMVAKVDIQGPMAEQILQQVTEADLKKINRYWFQNLSIDGVEITVSRTGYTGEDGFELYIPDTDAEKIWRKLLEVGRPHGLQACGLGSRDTLRTECGMMLYGHDIDTETTPLEAVYGWTVSFDKDFVGKIALIRQKEAGLEQKLIGFEMLERGIAREHYPIYFNGEQVGEVTSGTPSPTLGKNIGMGYIRYDLRKPGTEIEIQVRNNFVKAKIVKLPFYKRSA